MVNGVKHGSIFYAEKLHALLFTTSCEPCILVALQICKVLSDSDAFTFSRDIDGNIHSIVQR